MASECYSIEWRDLCYSQCVFCLLVLFPGLCQWTFKPMDSQPIAPLSQEDHSYFIRKQAGHPPNQNPFRRALSMLRGFIWLRFRLHCNSTDMLNLFSLSYVSIEYAGCTFWGAAVPCRKSRNILGKCFDVQTGDVECVYFCIYDDMRVERWFR